MINDLVTYEAEYVKSLKENFEKSVDDYLETCKKLNKKPEKSFRGVFNVRIKPNLHKAAYLVALRKGISLNSLINESVEEKVKSLI